jgi:pilus assembly protein Flp/PilA
MAQEVFADVGQGYPSLVPQARVNPISRFIADESGPTAVEYAIMLALIIMVCVSTIASVGTSAYSSLWDAVEALD